MTIYGAKKKVHIESWFCPACKVLRPYTTKLSRASCFCTGNEVECTRIPANANDFILESKKFLAIRGYEKCQTT